jgi:UDP-N-acetylmuramate: L-alanyl-gamma-D-glutamyl-meso-diaminopimelate ligase
MSDQLRALGIELIEGFDASQMALKPDVFRHRQRGQPRPQARRHAQVPAHGSHSGRRRALHQRPAVAGRACAARTPRAGRGRHPWQDHHHVDVGLDSGSSWIAAGFSGGRRAREFRGLRPRGWRDGAGFAQVKEEPAKRAGDTEQSHCAVAPSTAPFVIEADEYDTAFFDKRSKFVHYRPRTAILNNLEFDHADIFDNLAAIERQFHHLVRTVPSTGRVVVNGLEESLTRVLHAGCWSEVRSFGAAVSDFTAEGEPGHFDVLERGIRVATVDWPLGGVHNQLNALAAIAAAEHVGVSPAIAAQALGTFQNVKRRMEVRGTVNDITVYDDFAHHPTAIRTTLDGLRRQVGPHARILAVFEPRSNTMKLGTMKAQLPASLIDADLAFCHSGGLDWDARAALAPMGQRAQVADSIDALVVQVTAAAQPGDHILCMSNGGFGGVHARLLQSLQYK